MLTSFPFTGNYPTTGRTDRNRRRRESGLIRENLSNSHTRAENHFKDTTKCRRKKYRHS